MRLLLVASFDERMRLTVAGSPASTCNMLYIYIEHDEERRR